MGHMPSTCLWSLQVTLPSQHGGLDEIDGVIKQQVILLPGAHTRLRTRLRCAFKQASQKAQVPNKKGCLLQRLACNECCQVDRIRSASASAIPVKRNTSELYSAVCVRDSPCKSKQHLQYLLICKRSSLDSPPILALLLLTPVRGAYLRVASHGRPMPCLLLIYKWQLLINLTRICWEINQRMHGCQATKQGKQIGFGRQESQ